MIKQFIKSAIGDKNVQRIRRIQQSIRAVKSAWKISSGTLQSEADRIIFANLMGVHALEKIMAVENDKALSSRNYMPLIENVSKLLKLGISPEDFAVCESVAVIKSALNSVSGHEGEKAKLQALIAKYNIPQNYRGGVEKVSSQEIFAHNDFDFHGFVSSRSSIRKFKNTIISREVIYSIINDAQFYPSACNRQPCKVYFSDNEATAAKIISSIPDSFVTKGRVHDALIVTCDRALLSPAELNDQEYVNSGIFLGYLVMSIHAHNLGSCLFQFLQVSSSQEKIKRELGIKASEVIIGFVGIGELEDEVLCACAQRRPVESVAVNLK